MEIGKGNKNDQEEAAASLQKAMRNVGTLHFVEEKAEGCMSLLDAQDHEGEGQGECRPAAQQTCSSRSWGNVRET